MAERHGFRRKIANFANQNHKNYTSDKDEKVRKRIFLWRKNITFASNSKTETTEIMAARHAYNLGFISDEDIFNHVKQTVELYRTSINLQEFNKNIVDPIKLTFDAKVYGKSIESLIGDECIRQIDKTNSNHIGYFHQNLFRYAGRGWEVPANGVMGFDVQNPTLHIYAELKNKHNTMNAATVRKTLIKMQDKILNDKDAICMLVEYNVDVSHNENWEVALPTGTFSNERIRIVSIDKFYDAVFGDSAFKNLCEMLPTIINDVLEKES